MFGAGQRKVGRPRNHQRRVRAPRDDAEREGLESYPCSCVRRARARRPAGRAWKRQRATRSPALLSRGVRDPHEARV